MTELSGAAVAGAPPLTATKVIAVAASSALASFAMVYWLMRVKSAPSQPKPSHADRQDSAAAESSWSWAWPWTMRSSSRQAAEAAVAAERLSALARTNEAIESASDIPLASKSQLVAVPVPEGSSGQSAFKPFKEADLPTLQICTHRNGSRWVLGGGSAGQVCKALRDGKHPIALREFRYALTAEEEEELRQLVDKKRHGTDPNVVKPLGWAPIPKPDSGLYIAEPFFERGSLAEALTGPQAVSFRWYKPSWPGMSKIPGKGRDIALAVARALHWLHSNDLVHLDLRPSKVLLEKDDKAQLQDAGLAKFMHHDYIGAKTNVGPYAWTAPEVMWGEPGTPASDIWSYGVVLWQILTGGDPVTDRRRFVRGGELCPKAIADILVQCLDRNPAARPTAGEIVALLSRPESELPPALASRPGTQPPAGMPIENKSKQAVWNASTSWVYCVYGGKEKANAAGYRESLVERVLEAREWEQYAKFIHTYADLLEEPDVQTPGSQPYKRLLELYRAFHTHTNLKLAATAPASASLLSYLSDSLPQTADSVREQRFVNMESLDSLLALAQPEPEEQQMAAAAGAGGGTRASSGHSRDRSSIDSGAMLSPPQSPGPQPKTAHSRPPPLVVALELTDDQKKAILRAREEFKASQAAIVRQRNALVRLLSNFATGKDPDYDKALAASAKLRSNIFEEWTMWEAVSPWQLARAEAITFPGLASPVVLADELYSLSIGGGRHATQSTWQGIVQEGDFTDLYCDPEKTIE